MKEVKVLVFDEDWFRSYASYFSVTVTITYECELGIYNSYARTNQFSDLISRESKEYDVIVIGNNLGSGVYKAKAIPEEIRDRVIVVWNDYRQGDERPYADLGISRFGSRSDLIQLIEQAIEELF